ncbi:MAG: antitoxin Xre-like helix-turn-helix domain-containing protein [Pseudomonadota bacterium]
MARVQDFAKSGDVTEAARICGLLAVACEGPSELSLADAVHEGLPVTAADRLIELVGKERIVGPVIPEATLRRARASGVLSREHSERIYELGRVIERLSRTYKGDMGAVRRFLDKPHRLLERRTPLDVACAGAAGTVAVLNMLERAEAGFAV